jgi:NAD(P)-dependent dehydrogenase (short-subunit alcohol dehydrogenase family)
LSSDSSATSDPRSIPRAALSRLLDEARAALDAGDDARAGTLLAELHWYAHKDGALHEAVHRLELARARQQGDVRGALLQLVPLATARATSLVESLGPSFEIVQPIDAPPDVVYRVLADVGAYVTWNPWVVHARGEARVGGEIVVQARLGGGTMQVTHRVIATAPGERFAWCDLGLFTYFASGRRLRWIEKTATGSRLVSRIDLFGPFAHLAWRLHGDHIRDGLTAEARALADRAAALARASKSNGKTARGEKPLGGMTCAITGPTRGIGRPTALALGELGARVLLLCRNREQGAELAREIDARGGKGEVIAVDLSSLRSVADAAQAVRAQAPRLDVLINNAGVLNHERKLTADGYEQAFGVNFLAHYLLTTRLLPSLAAAPAARVVHLASNTHEVIRGFDFDDYNWERRRFISIRAYGHSKLAVLLFNRSLAKQLSATRIVSNALHPGIIATGMGTDLPYIGPALTRLVRPIFLTPEEGARTTLFVAANPSAAAHRGAYFVKCRPVRPSRWAEDDAAAERIYKLGESLLERHGLARGTA